MGLEVNEYSPKLIKKSVTGNGNASKEQVSAMLESILKVKIQSEYHDATDALATAYCHYNQHGFGTGTKEKLAGAGSHFTTKPGADKKSRDQVNETKILITDKVHHLLPQGLEEMGFDVLYDTSIGMEQLPDIIAGYTGIVINSKIK